MIISDRAQPIFPERRAEFDAVGAAQDVADGLDEARRGPQADERAEPQQAARCARSALRVTGARKRLGDVGRQLGEDGRDGQLRRSSVWPSRWRDRRGEDEEGEQRQQRQISEVAGVDEAVVVDADGDPLDHFPRRDAAASASRRRRGRTPPRMLASRLRRASGDWGERSFMPERLNAKRRRAGCRRRSSARRSLELGVAGRQVDLRP